MSSDGVHIRIEGRAGRVTLDRPEALNALTHDIVLAVDAALAEWATDDRVAMLVVDAVGDKAFCAGGDLQEIYDAGKAGNAALARTFWRDEYRMNARLFEFPKPVASFMHGYTLGGGVGLGCHASHRIVGETSQIAMPEVSIGLMPDVGGTLLLARCPGRLGEYLGTTAARMGPGCAIHAEFADYFVPEAGWPALRAELCETGDWDAVDRAAVVPPDSPLTALQPRIDHYFGGETLGDILRGFRAEPNAFTEEAERKMARNAPLAMACAVEGIHRMQGPAAGIRQALDLEYRFAWRAIDQGDFIEGIRALIIDKDHAPRWRQDFGDVPLREVTAMLMPLGADALDLREVRA